MMIFDDYNGPLTPSTYKWAQEAYESVITNPWNHFEANMVSDITDWKDNIPEQDKLAISGILLGFTELEKSIGDYWRNLATLFSYPELVAMCNAFSYSESVHAYGYKHLEDTLGINTYDKLNTNTYAQAKLNHFKLPSETPVSDRPYQIALLSGCGEGVSLFSSFAILLSYRKAGFMKGLGQILSWSVRDENLHSDSAANLFKELIKEYPQPKQKKIHEAFHEAYQIEMSFVTDAFSNGNLLNITLNDVRNFVRDRCNNRLNVLGYDSLYSDSETSNNVSEWFYPMVLGTPKIDFFADNVNGGAYSASAGSNLDGFDFSELSEDYDILFTYPSEDSIFE